MQVLKRRSPLSTIGFISFRIFIIQLLRLTPQYKQLFVHDGEKYVFIGQNKYY